MDENNNIAKNYDPKEFEERLYKWWEESGFFTPEVDENKKPYTSNNATTKYYRTTTPWSCFR